MSRRQTAAVVDPAGRSGVVRRNPNASVAVGSGSGVGALIVWVVGLGGVVMPGPIGAVIGGGVAGFALLIGRRGGRLIEPIWGRRPGSRLRLALPGRNRLLMLDTRRVRVARRQPGAAMTD